MPKVAASLMALAAFVVPAAAQHEPDLPQPGLKDLGQGKWSITVEKLVDHGDYALTANPPCNAAANTDVNKILQAVLAASKASPSVAILTAPLVDKVSAEVDKALRQNRGFIAGVLAPNRAAACAVVGAIVPKNSAIDSIVYRAGDGSRGQGVCTKDGNGWMVCPQGYCKWDDIHIRPADQVVSAVFKNWSNDRARWANLTVIFTPRKGVVPHYVQ